MFQETIKTIVWFMLSALHPVESFTTCKAIVSHVLCFVNTGAGTLHTVFLCQLAHSWIANRALYKNTSRWKGQGLAPFFLVPVGFLLASCSHQHQKPCFFPLQPHFVLDAAVCSSPTSGEPPHCAPSQTPALAQHLVLRGLGFCSVSLFPKFGHFKHSKIFPLLEP